LRYFKTGKNRDAFRTRFKAVLKSRVNVIIIALF
jgi:hypothetical protein